MTSVLPADMVLPGRVLTGIGCLDSFADIATRFGDRGLIVYSRSVGRTDFLASLSFGERTLAWRYPGGEPTLETVEDLLQVARGHGAEWVAGIGGGSVLDCAKAVAGLVDAPGSVADYHGGRSIDARGIPFLAVPTTAGSGSEATMVSVLSDPDKGVKKSIRDPQFIARTVFLDANVLRGLTEKQAIFSGMDALVQAIEAFCSRKRTPWTDDFARRALLLILGNLPAFCADRSDADAAEAVLTGSFLAGMALSGARLGVAHGLAHPVGMHTGLGHGLVCAIALPHVLRFNRESDPDRFAELDALCGGSVDAKVATFIHTFGIPPNTGVPAPKDPAPLVAEVLASGSTAANPRKVTETDARALLNLMYSS